jgi:hypothetical protein
MDIQQLMAKLNSPEEIDKLATRMAEFGPPPEGMPTMPGKAPAAPQVPDQDLGSFLGGLPNGNRT